MQLNGTTEYWIISEFTYYSREHEKRALAPAVRCSYLRCNHWALVLNILLSCCSYLSYSRMIFVVDVVVWDQLPKNYRLEHDSQRSFFVHPTIVKNYMVAIISAFVHLHSFAKLIFKELWDCRSTLFKTLIHLLLSL